ncbi:MAG: FAD:protein FMN transferase [Flavobacteriaceae bacterium]|nr:FAD:protein FMN transferase [Flavobacteriaceae bacterium]
MGCTFELGVVHTSETMAQEYFQIGIKEIQRIEALLSEFLEDSVTSTINRNAADHEVVLPSEVFQLIKRCLQLSQLTRGHFDITIGPLKALYHFNKEEQVIPPKDIIKKQLEKVGYQNILLNEEAQTIKFKTKGMRLSFAAIGKGYAADSVIKLWRQHGLTSAYLNASGDLTAIGTSEKNQPWHIAISDPDQPTNALLHVPLKDSSIATSGDYEQFLLYRGKKYSHTLHPKTGYPVELVKSVSVCSPSAELSDALATTLHVMGPKKGISFIDQLPQTHAIMIDEKNEIHFSKHLDYEAVS